LDVGVDGVGLGHDVFEADIGFTELGVP